MSDVRWQPGDRAVFSEAGVAKVRSMPEAWGLHRALSEGLTGEVLDVDLEGENVVLSVDFGSGSAHYWPAECFRPCGADVLPDGT